MTASPTDDLASAERAIQELTKELSQARGELVEAREQQATTAKILSVISGSRGELHRVFAALAVDAARLCDAFDAAIYQVDGEVLRVVAHHGPIDIGIVGDFTLPLTRDIALGRAVIERGSLHIADLQAEGKEYPEGRDYALRWNFHTQLAVPLRRAGDSLGVIVIRSAEVRPFTDGQIELLRSFADQAVIAIENTRLLEEVQARKPELRAALEQQTATSQILSVISRSPTDVQPVFAAIAESAVRLCGANYGSTMRLDGDVMTLVAHKGQSEHWLETVSRLFPQRLTRDLIAGSAILDREIVHVTDMQNDPRFPTSRALAQTMGYRTVLCVPMLRDCAPIGAILVFRQRAQPFDEAQISLLRTFADQAVIAIENTRLFEAEQASKRELQESLEQQTATTDVLQVISSSPGELQHVFDGILSNATRVCGANLGNLILCEGEVFRHVAMFGAPPEFAEMRRGKPVVRPAPNSILDRITTAKQPQHILDFRAEQSYLDQSPASVQLVEIAGARTVLGVPLISANKVIGIIAIYRRHVQAFTTKQIELVANFAKQAVIAIENARLFEAEQASKRELQESLEYQTATSEVLNVISRSPSQVQPVLDAIAGTAARLCSAEYAFIGKAVDNKIHLAAASSMDSEHARWLQQHPVSIDRSSATGRTALERRAIHITDILADPEFAHHDWQNVGRQRTILGVPLLHEGNLVGVIMLVRNMVRPFTDRQIELVNTFADQAVIAIENTRLFEEVQHRTRELAKTVEDLEIASQHKNQFVANMSHELRTPLAAILGYAELIQEGFYEPQGPKSLDALTRIRSNGKHLLGLINTVLDIAKIESGQFTLNMTEYAIESVVETVRSATESLAQNKKLALKTEVAKSLPVGLGDEQRLTQVLLNLVGNAIKFTDAGEVRVTARAVNGHFNVTVADTGPGIPQEHQGRIFEHFHQVDSSLTKAKGGTGLGLAIAKDIVEMHGGRIWVESTVGKGSTFQMEIPTRAEFRKRAL